MPARCLDGDGFTLAEFGQPNDPHHGNESYGALMMGEVLSHLRPDRSKPAPAPALHEGHANP